MTKATPNKISPELTAARKQLAQLLESKGEQALILEDQLQVIDRLTKIETLEHRMGKGAAGSALDDEDDE